MAKNEDKGPAPRDPSYWQQVLDDIKSSSTGNLFLVKEGRTKVRLVPLVGKDGGTEEFRPVIATFAGSKKTKYLLSGYILGDDPPTLKGILIPKTVLSALVNLQVEQLSDGGAGFWDNEEGVGLTIVRSGTGRNTDYTLSPSPKAVKVPQAILDQVENLTFDMLEASFDAMQNRRSSGGSSSSSSDDEDEGDEAPW